MNSMLRGAAVAIAILFSTELNAGLVGTELTLSTVAELTSTSQTIVTSFPRITTVSATLVEYPDVASLFDPNTPTLPGFAHSLVDTAIDAGDNFITFDFTNAGSSSFASAFKNGYLFEFDSQAAATITGASIDKLTTLGLVPSDVTFSGNQLFVNVEGLSFTPSSFAKIDLVVEGGPSAVPEPSTLIVMLGCLAAFGLVPSIRRRLMMAM